MKCFQYSKYLPEGTAHHEKKLEMNNTTMFEELGLKNIDWYESSETIRKIEDGKYILLIYFICLVMIFVHFILFFHILFGFKTLKDSIRNMLINNKVSSHEIGFSHLWTVEPIESRPGS